MALQSALYESRVNRPEHIRHERLPDADFGAFSKHSATGRLIGMGRRSLVRFNAPGNRHLPGKI